MFSSSPSNQRLLKKLTVNSDANLLSNQLVCTTELDPAFKNASRISENSSLPPQAGKNASVLIERELISFAVGK